jgi:DNA-directed RNA polymerase specialized sigma24 family protein
MTVLDRLTNDASLAEDLVSEVFLGVWRHAAGFEGKSQVATWMLAIARHKAFSALKRRPHESCRSCLRRGCFFVAVVSPASLEASVRSCTEPYARW